MALMNLQHEAVKMWMDKATPEALRLLLPGILAKGTPAQWQAVLDCVLTEAKRRQIQ